MRKHDDYNFSEDFKEIVKRVAENYRNKENRIDPWWEHELRSALFELSEQADQETDFFDPEEPWEGLYNMLVAKALELRCEALENQRDMEFMINIQ